MNLDLIDLQNLRDALDDVIGYLTDNSCSDPDCCGGPYYDVESFDAGVSVLKNFGLNYYFRSTGN